VPAPVSSIDNCASNLACDEVMYSVYLVQGQFINDPVFDYQYFSVAGKVLLNSALGEYIDVAKSRLCSPNWDAAQLSIEPTGAVTLALGDVTSGVTNTIPLQQKRAELFSIIVHTSPGSTVSLKANFPGSNNPYLWAFGKNTNYGFNCSGQFGITIAGALTPDLTGPTQNVCSSLSYEFFNIDPISNIAQSEPTPFLVPINLAGGTVPITFSEIEMAIEIKSTNYMETGNITGGLIHCLDISVPGCDIEVSDIESGGFYYRNIFARSYNRNFDPSSSNVFLNIYLGPLNRSLGGTCEIKVKYIRLKEGTNCCLLAPKDTDQRILNFAGLPVCPNYSLKITDGTGLSDCEVVQNLNFTWTLPQNQITFDKLTFKAVFVSGMPITEIRGNTICPNGSCVTITNAGDSREVTFSVTNTTLSRNQLKFSVVFGGATGCIRSMWFVKSEVDDQFSTGGCVPTLTPTSFYPFPTPRCLNRIAGKITYFFNSCDEFEISAQPNNPLSTSCFRVSQLVDMNVSNYGLCVCSGEFPYKVKCSTENNDPRCGVTTYDLLLISTHLNSINPFTTPHQYVAADCNCSNSVNQQDIINIREVILGATESFPSNTPSFKIYKSNDPLSLPMWQIAGCASIGESVVNAPNTNTNFEVVKTGDINRSCQKGASCLTSDEVIDDRTEREIGLIINTDKAIRQDDYFLIPITVGHVLETVAFQFELGYNPDELQVQDIIIGDYPDITTEFTHLNEPGFLRFAWNANDYQGIRFETEKVLAYIKVKSNSILSANPFNVRYRNDIGIQPVAYSADGTEWRFTDRTSPAIIAQTRFDAMIVPNPTNGHCDIQLTVPVDGTCIIRMYTLTGQLISEQKFDTAQGTNTVSMDQYLLGQPAGQMFAEVIFGHTAQMLRFSKI
jgi:hypothetical protein